MIDFATLLGLTIPEGVVTKIEDAAGRVLWRSDVGEVAVLNMQKSTETICTGEVSCEEER